MCQLTFFILA